MPGSGDKSKSSVRLRRVLLGLFVLVAFALRLGYYIDDPDPERLAGLALPQGEVARNIVEHGKWGVLNPYAPTRALQADCRCLVSPSEIDYSEADRRAGEGDLIPLALHTQGTALVMAGVWAVTGDLDYSYIQILQIVLASLAVLLVYWIALKLFHRQRAALIAAGLYAVFAPLAPIMKLPFYDPWAILAAIAVLAAFVKARERGGDWRWLAVIGVLTGIGLNFRPAIIFVPLLMAAALLFTRGWRTAFRYGAISVGVALLFALPSTVRNYAEFDRLIPVHSGTGQVLWEGLGERPNSFGAVESDEETLEMVVRENPEVAFRTPDEYQRHLRGDTPTINGQPAYTGYGSPDYDSYLLEKSRDAILDHPLFYGELIGRRFVDATIGLNNTRWAEGTWERHQQRGDSRLEAIVNHPLDAAVLGLSKYGEQLVILAALLTAALTWRRFREEHLVLLGFVLGVILVPIFLNFDWRYVAATYVAWIVLFALGSDLLLDRVRRMGVRRGLVPLWPEKHAEKHG